MLRTRDNRYRDGYTRCNHVAKLKVLTHYGNGKCACVRCGFDDVRALSIDHINGYGKKKTKTESIRSGTGLYYFLIRNCYPPGFQTLCMNCQFIKRAINKERMGYDCKYNDSPEYSRLDMPTLF